MQSIDTRGSSKNPINRVMDYKLHGHGIFGVMCRCPTRIGYRNWYDSPDSGVRAIFFLASPTWRRRGSNTSDTPTVKKKKKKKRKKQKNLIDGLTNTIDFVIYPKITSLRSH